MKTTSKPPSPAGFEPRDCAQYVVCANAVSPTVTERICCRGKVYRPDGPIIVDPEPIDPDAVIPIFPPDEWVPICYTLTSSDSSARAITLRVTDGSGVLEYADAPGGASSLIYDSAPFTIDPGETKKVTIYGRRIDAGVPDPVFFDIILEVAPASDPAAGVIAAVTPAVLTAHEEVEVAAQMADIEAISFASAPPRVALEVQTALGRVYQLQQSGDLQSHNWQAMPCEVNGIESDGEGRFIGTGASVIIHLPCDFDRPAMFYRAALMD